MLPVFPEKATLKEEEIKSTSENKEDFEADDITDDKLLVSRNPTLNATMTSLKKTTSLSRKSSF
jgi:hypothetical protein